MDEKYRMTINMSWTTVSLLFPVLFYFLSSKKVRQRKDVQLIIGLTFLTFVVNFYQEAILNYSNVNEIGNIYDLIFFLLIISFFTFETPKILTKKQYILICFSSLLVGLFCMYFFGLSNPKNPMQQIITFALFLLIILFTINYKKIHSKNKIVKTFFFWSFSPNLFCYLVYPFVFDVSVNYSYNTGGLINNLAQAWVSLSLIIGLFVADNEESYYNSIEI
jgi:hypothetical protein